MAKIVLDKCLDVTEVPLEVHVSPSDSNTPTYWVQAFWTQSDELNPIKADAITLAEDGECRVIFWEGDDAPTEMPSLEGPGGEAPSVIWAFSPEGSATVIDGLADDDPWPRRGTKKERSEGPSQRTAKKTKPAARKAKAKPAARKVKAKPAARKAKPKPAARRVKKPVAKKAPPRKAAAKKKAPAKKKAARPSRRR